MIFRRLITSSVLIALVFAQSSAHAQTAPDTALARDLFKEGAKFAQDGQWNEARQRYEKSLALRRAPLTLYSLGVAYRNLRRFVEALESFRAYLVEMNKADERDKAYEGQARESVAELEKLVAQLDIKILSKDEDQKTMLTIDGIIVPEAAYGYPRLVDPGTHTILLRSQGFRDATQVVTLGEGEKQALSLRLVPLGDSDPSRPRGTAKPEQVPIVPTALVAGGSALFAVGLTLGFVGVQQASDAPTRDGDDAKHARKLGIAGDVVGGVGVVAAGAGLTLLLIDKYGRSGRSKAKPATGWVAPVVAPSGLGVVGQF